MRTDIHLLIKVCGLDKNHCSNKQGLIINSTAHPTKADSQDLNLFKMAIGRVLELLVVLAHIFVIVRQFYPNEERSGLIEKVNIRHCTENAAFCHDGSDTDGLKWSFGFDRFYRRHLGFGKGQGFSPRQGKKSSGSLIFGLILICWGCVPKSWAR